MMRLGRLLAFNAHLLKHASADHKSADHQRFIFFIEVIQMKGGDFTGIGSIGKNPIKKQSFFPFSTTPIHAK